MNVPREKRASAVFLAWAWGSAATVVLSIVLSIIRAIPGWLEPVFFTGIAGVALTGAVVGVGYMISAFWMRARVLLAVVPLAINSLFLVLMFGAPKLV